MMATQCSTLTNQRLRIVQMKKRSLAGPLKCRFVFAIARRLFFPNAMSVMLEARKE